MPHKDRKVVAVGLTRMLTESRVMLSEPASRSWCVRSIVWLSFRSLLPPRTHRPAVFTTLVKLFSEPQYLASKEGESTGGTGVTEIDYEEQTAGYQAAYSRLAASESAPVDPVGYVTDVRAFLGRRLGMMDKGVLVGMGGGVQEEGARVFLEGLVREGYLVV